MSAKTLLIVGLAILSIANARVVRDAPSDVAETNPFLTALNTIQSSYQQLESSFLKAFGAENSEQLKQKGLEQGRALAQNLDKWAQQLKEEASELPNNPHVVEVRKSIDNLITDFSAKHPETSEDVKKFIADSTKRAEDLIAKTKELSEGESAQKVKEISQQFVEKASSTFQEIFKEVQTELSKNAAPQ